jgi:5-methyltetrahydrofolate--homocysteine methyltransferase
MNRSGALEIVKQIIDAVIVGNIADIQRLSKEAIEQKVAPQELIDEGFRTGLDIVGEKYTNGEYFLPEMLVAGMVVKSGMEILKPLLIKSDLKSKGVMVVGTVAGDIHDIGKNMVCMMCEASGLTVIDLGTDVTAEMFINAAKENGADIIAMSALLSTTRANMPGMIQIIRASEIGHKVKVMVGGAPVTLDFAEAIEADGYAPDAVLAAKKARQLLGIK